MTIPVFEPQALDEFLLKLFPLGHISKSAVTQHNRCPEQFRRVRLLNEKAPPSGSLLLGSAAHATAEHNFVQKIQTEKDVPVSEIDLFFANDYEKRFENEGGPDEVDWTGAEFRGKAPKDLFATLKTAGAKIVRGYHNTIAPTLFPETVEEEFLIQPGDLPLPVKGYIDVVARRRSLLGMSEPFIIERKTRKDRRAPKAEDFFQGSVYQLARPLPVEFQISARSSGETLLFPPVEWTVTQAVGMLRTSLLEMASNFALYGAERPWPGKGRLHDWACDWCGFRSSCPWWEEAYWPR